MYDKKIKHLHIVHETLIHVVKPFRLTWVRCSVVKAFGPDAKITQMSAGIAICKGMWGGVKDGPLLSLVLTFI